MEIYTIGFTKKPAEQFFTLLKHVGIRRLIDVRLNNSSQLAGFAKKEDLAYFLRELIDVEYCHEVSLAPSEPLLKAYRSKQIDWPRYAHEFTDLMSSRRIESAIDWGELLDGGSALLCSEASPERCHRRLVAEYLAAHGFPLEVHHL